MSEEEKKAIEIVKNIEQEDLLDCWDQQRQYEDLSSLYANKIKEEKKI